MNTKYIEINKKVVKNYKLFNNKQKNGQYIVTYILRNFMCAFIYIYK